MPFLPFLERTDGEEAKEKNKVLDFSTSSNAQLIFKINDWIPSSSMIVFLYEP